MFYIRRILGFSYWYHILGAHLIFPVISHSLYSSRNIRTQRCELNKYLATCSLLEIKIAIANHVAIHL